MGGLRHSLRLLAVLGVLSGSALAQETANDSDFAKMLKLSSQPARALTTIRRPMKRRKVHARLSRS